MRIIVNYDTYKPATFVAATIVADMEKRLAQMLDGQEIEINDPVSFLALRICAGRQKVEMKIYDYGLNGSTDIYYVDENGKFMCHDYPRDVIDDLLSTLLEMRI